MIITAWSKETLRKAPYGSVTFIDCKVYIRLLQALQLKRWCCWAKGVVCICDIWLFVCRLYNYGMGVHLLQVEEDIELAIQNRNREINPRDDHISFQVHSPSLAQIKIIMYLGLHFRCLLISCCSEFNSWGSSKFCYGWLLYLKRGLCCGIQSNRLHELFFWHPTLTFLATTLQHDIRHCVLILWSHRNLENRRETWKNACLWGYQIPVLSTQVLGVS